MFHVVLCEIPCDSKQDYGIIYVNYVTNHISSNAEEEEGWGNKIAKATVRMAEGVKVCIVLTLKPRFTTAMVRWTA